MRSKKMKKMFTTLLALITTVSTAMVGCSSPQETTQVQTQTPAKEEAKDAPKTETPETTETDLLGKYEEPVTITVARRTFGTDEIDEHWKEVLLRDYNINVEIVLEADATQYDEKVNIAIASGQIPDLLSVNPQQMDIMVKAGMAADLTDLLNEQLTPKSKEYLMTGVGAEALEAVTYDGKVMFIPTNITSLINNAFPLFLRKDWLDNLGLEVPKTIEEFKEVAIAFTKQDPDGNGKDDTYGLAVSGQSNLIEDWGGLFGFFSAYGVQPCLWYDGMLFYSKDASGNVVWDGTKPEVKEGLQLLADLYKEGAIPKDFPTMDINRVSEDLNSGAAGMVFGVRGLPYWAIQNTIKNNPEAEWYAMNMPTKDGSPAPIFTYQPVNTAMAISAECKNPEAVIKMLNVYQALTDSESPLYDEKTTVPEVQRGAFIGVENPYREVEMHKRLFEAIEKKDSSILKENEIPTYDKVMDYMETKNPENWGAWNAVYPEEGHAYYLVFGLNDESMLKKNEWWALPSENMLTKLPIYQKLAEETFTEIITGVAPVAEWDNMVGQWNKLGGEEVTQEVLDHLN